LFASFGLQTAAIAATGEGPPGGAPHLSAVESWNGTSWSEVAEVNTPRREVPGAGVQTAGLIISGNIDPPITTNVESWDGSAWTEIANVNTGRNNAASSGTQTSALTFGGYTGTVLSNTEYWNGSTWTEINDLANGTYVSGFGTGTTTAWKAGGLAPGITAVTEEFSAPALFTKVNLGQVYYNSTSNAFKVTQQSTPLGTWASGGALPSPMYLGTGCGASNTSGMAMTGYSDPAITYSSAAYQYDGASWTTVASLNTGKNNASSAKNSPITTTLNYAGDGPGTYSATNESWNNTSWTEEADLNVSGNAATGFGVSSTSAGRAGGQSSVTPPAGPHFTGTEIWNGTSWTEVSDLAASRRYAGGVGTVTAALYIGGDTDNPAFPGGRFTARVESWNGTSWTEIADLNTGKYSVAAAGTQTSALAFGGDTPPYTTATEFWNGTSWTELNDMAIARRGGTGNGSSTSALSVAGDYPGSPPFLAATEEWTAGTANSTLTVS